ncbi:stress protection protein MarC [Pantoea rodasii]|uniref:MarC family NAAT transporter n=1 Tax=Pantoea rodasii TaxID=1076549 RepID=UPI000A217738|nr:MarC family NAAT transporter [Pantoea rodasii]ORM65023.1 stress protection protein MarC [Pantoea rodasii]
MFELFKAIGLGLVVILPLANPLTTVALFLGLAGDMNFQERNRQAMQASIYVFLIMMVAWYAGNAVLHTFGISIPGLRMAGGLIVAFIGFRMLFPAKPVGHSVEAEHKQDEIDATDANRESVNIAFVPLAMPSTAGPGTIAMIISSASTVKAGVDFPNWVVNVAPVLTFLSVAVILWISLRSSGAIMKLVGKGGIEAISRLMGFLLVCMGVQFVINGVLEVVRTFIRIAPPGRGAIY